MRHGKKPSFRSDFDSFGPKKNFFSRIWLRQSLDVMVSYHHVKHKKKTNDPILRKLSHGGTDGQTDRHTDRQTDRQELFHRMLSD